MRELHTQTLSEECGKCFALPHYHLGVVMPTTRERTLFGREIAKQLRASYVGNQMYRTYNWPEMSIRLQNGSLIQFVQAEDRFRGHKFHTLLYDPRVSRDALYRVFANAEITKYDYSRYKGDAQNAESWCF